MNARHDPQPAVAPPPDYRIHARLDLKNDRRTSAAVRVVLALTVALSLGAAVVLDLPLRSGWGTMPTVAVTAVACLGYLAVHELTHGLVSRMFSRVRPTYSLRFPFLTTGSEAWLTRNAAVTVTLAPVALWGAVLVTFLFTVPVDFVLTVFVVTVVNFAGSAGDYVQAGVLSRLPASALVQDDGHRTTAAVPAGSPNLQAGADGFAGSDRSNVQTMSEAKLHHVKVETFDVAAHTNVDPKGFVRKVEVYRVERWGLYMARPADHPQFGYLESWLLPELGLRASIFHFRPGFERDQDRYVDIGEFWREGDVWHSRDHYLDLVVRTGRDTAVEDVDELLAAAAAGLLDLGTAERAVQRALRAVDGIATHGHDLDAWLAALAMPISWR